MTLAAAAVLAVAWLAWPSPEQAATTTTAEALATVWETWEAEPVEWPGTVDGRAWTPLKVLGDGAALGLDESGNLLYVTLGEAGDAAATVLAEPGGVPGVVAAAATGDRIAWIASVPDARGKIVSGLWAADRGADGAPGEARLLTADTGDVITAGSAYDLQFADGGLHWLAAAGGDALATEHRSIPAEDGAFEGGALEGGTFEGSTVAVTEHAGSWQAAAWPWLTSSASDSLGGAQLVRADTGEGVRVFSDTDALTLCSAAWCRLVVNDGDGARIDLVRPDGTDRVTVSEGYRSAVSPDVGLLDRFEPLAESTAATGDATEATLFDLEAGQAYLVASGAGGTGADAGSLWWSTGTGELLAWHVLDLTDLA